MDLPFNGVGITKNKRHSTSYPPSPTNSEVNRGCFNCCCGNKTAQSPPPSEGGKTAKEEVSLNLNDFPRPWSQDSKGGHVNNQDRIVEEQNGHDFSPDVPRSLHNDNTLSLRVSSPNQTSNSCSSTLVANQNQNNTSSDTAVTSAIVTISQTPGSMQPGPVQQIQKYSPLSPTDPNNQAQVKISNL